MEKAQAVVAVQSAEPDGLRVATVKHPPPASSSTLPAGIRPLATSSRTTTPRLPVVLAAFAVVVLAGLLEWLLFYRTNIPKAWLTVGTPVTGVGIFAVFFVAAQGIERLLEPVADFVQGDTAGTVAKNTVEANHSLSAAGANPDPEGPTVTAANKAVQSVANAVAADTRSGAERKVVFWSIACVIGIAGAAALHLFLFKTIGFKGAPPALDIFATGLVIGAGTKPLHDLTTLLSAQAATAKAGSTP